MRLSRGELAVVALAAAFMCFVGGAVISGQTGAFADNVSVNTSKSGAAQADRNADLMVNINTATAAELTALTGIGDSLSGAIVEYREENGLFETIEEIMDVPGIGGGKFSNIKDHICVE